MQRVIVVCSDAQLERLTDFLVQNKFRYESEMSLASDPLGEDVAYENLRGFTAESIAHVAHADYGVKLSPMNCHRVLDCMDEDDYDGDQLEDIIRRVVHDNPHSV